MFRAGVAAFDGVEELDAVGPYEVFGVAASRRPSITVDLLGTADDGAVRGAHGLDLVPSGRLEGATLDVLVIPGGGWIDDGPGIRTELKAGRLRGPIEAHARSGATVASVCTGAFALADVGLLDGRPAATHAGALDDLAAAGAEPVDARVVDDGDVVTAGGVSAGIDLALWLLERVDGADLADEVARTIEYERRGDVYCHTPGDA